MSAATGAMAMPDHELYRKLVLAHARAPHNFGPLPSATHCADGINPLCGDKLSLYLEIGSGSRIDDIRFEGTGCAISLASASMLTDAIAGASTTDALWLRELVVRLLETPPEQVVEIDEEFMRPVLALSGVRQFPMRVKCATLAWQALASAINNERGAAPRAVSTE